MTSTHVRRRNAPAWCVAAALVASTLGFSGAALSTPAQAAETCDVTEGTLTWGFRESFRSYISGSIANGSWETSDGATYETPTFMFAATGGSIDPATGEGRVEFRGTVNFTGHDGVLQTTIANPVVEFEGEGAMAVLLDTSSTDMEGTETIDESGVWFADGDAPETLPISNDTLSLVEMPATLTNDGARAFAGFYEAGESLDPLTLDVSLSGCEGVEAAGDADTETDTDTETPDATASESSAAAGPEIPWLPVIVGGVALLVIGLTVGMLLSGRRRDHDSGDESA